MTKRVLGVVVPLGVPDLVSVSAYYAALGSNNLPGWGNLGIRGAGEWN